jgi:hypothetical protein
MIWKISWINSFVSQLASWSWCFITAIKPWLGQGREGPGRKNGQGRAEGVGGRIWHWVGEKHWSPEGQQKECKQANSGNRRLGTPPPRMYQRPRKWETPRTQREGPYMKRPRVGRAHLQQKDRTSSEGWGCHPTVTSLTHNSSCLEELQG